MTQTTQPASPGAKTRPQMVADASRDELRSPDREWARERPIEPSEKFDLTRFQLDPKMDFLFAGTRIPYTTLKNPRLDQFRRAGWAFARAADFPELSGYKPGDKADRRLIELGLESEVRADDPVILDNNVLMMRPKRLSDEARRELDAAARRQITDHLRKQKENSERQIGTNRTRVSRTYDRPDEAPSDAADSPEY